MGCRWWLLGEDKDDVGMLERQCAEHFEGGIDSGEVVVFAVGASEFDWLSLGITKGYSRELKAVFD